MRQRSFRTYRRTSFCSTKKTPTSSAGSPAGETIDLPVVQRDNEYYLSHNYFGEWDSNGTVFLNERNMIYPRDSILLVHGHNMRSGAMFGTLVKYERASYAFEHALLTFRTLYEEEASYYVPRGGVPCLHACGRSGLL